MTENEKLTRRTSLLRLAGLAAAAGAGAAWKVESADAGPKAVSVGLVKCVLTPELTEGPYYVAGEKIRRDITEGKPGVALLLNLTVMNASTCALVKNAAAVTRACWRSSGTAPAMSAPSRWAFTSDNLGQAPCGAWPRFDQADRSAIRK